MPSHSRGETNVSIFTGGAAHVLLRCVMLVSAAGRVSRVLWYVRGGVTGRSLGGHREVTGRSAPCGVFEHADQTSVSFWHADEHPRHPTHAN